MNTKVSVIFDCDVGYVEICLDKGNCYGRTVVDFSGITGKKPNALVGSTLNLDRFWNMLEENLKRLN